ncbi:hypothetical protein MHW99_07235 [Corynebacterium sp. ACRPX]|uniref:hypothetical protein n=1 Tax=Corynebacterium sp. ACRPX TaxID=2918185 RepID=UPI001EF5AB97|nr:hypothetical protein [Corynebacterium sp. ACRPX]MCG7245628.1 hypothetical protein [Corynebacterium sp. ACRPX]
MSGNGTPKSLSIPIIIVTTALVVVIGIAIGLSLNNSDEPQRPEVPSSSQPTSPSSTPPSSTSSTSTSKTTTTTTTTSKSSETSSSTPSTSTSSSSSTPSTSTSSSSSTTTSSEPTSAPEGQDFGTGRSDLDGLGFVGSSARCDSGDRAFAVVAAEQGIKAAACETRSGEKYYRSDTPQGSGSMDIIVDEGDRVVAQNGSYKYQMSPDGVLVTKDNEVVKKYAAEAWGTA